MPTCVINMASLSPSTYKYAEEFTHLKKWMTPEERERFLRYLQAHDAFARRRNGESTQLSKSIWFERSSSDDDDSAILDKSVEGEPEVPEDFDDGEEQQHYGDAASPSYMDYESALESDLCDSSSSDSDDSDFSEDSEDDQEEQDNGMPTQKTTTDSSIRTGIEGFEPYFQHNRMFIPHELIEESEEAVDRKRTFTEPKTYDDDLNNRQTYHQSTNSEHPSKRQRTASSTKHSVEGQEAAQPAVVAVSVPRSQASSPSSPSRGGPLGYWPVRHEVFVPTYRGLGKGPRVE